MRVDIATYMELRNAGYTAAEINAYAADLPAPAPDQGPEPAPAPVPEPVPAPVPEPVPAPVPAPVQAPATDNTDLLQSILQAIQAPATDNTDLLQSILQAIQGMYVNNSKMPEVHIRTADDVMAEIINPKG